MTARPLEVKALTPLLEQDWDTPEALARVLIDTLDKVRADRTSYVVVVAVGDHSKQVVYTGAGPYPGWRSAEKVMHKMLADLGTLNPRGAVVPILTPEGHEAHYREISAQRAPKEHETVKKMPRPKGTHLGPKGTEAEAIFCLRHERWENLPGACKRKVG